MKETLSNDEWKAERIRELASESEEIHEAEEEEL